MRNKIILTIHNFNEIVTCPEKPVYWLQESTLEWRHSFCRAESLKPLFTNDIIILFSCLIQHINEFTGLMGIKGFFVHLNNMNYLSGPTQGQFLCDARSSEMIISRSTIHLLWYQPFLSPLTFLIFGKIVFFCLEL